MSRVKRGVTAHAAHKKVIKQAKGYFNQFMDADRNGLERLAQVRV